MCVYIGLTTSQWTMPTRYQHVKFNYTYSTGLHWHIQLIYSPFSSLSTRWNYSYEAVVRAHMHLIVSDILNLPCFPSKRAMVEYKSRHGRIQIPVIKYTTITGRTKCTCIRNGCTVLSSCTHHGSSGCKINKLVKLVKLVNMYLDNI